VRSQPRGKYIFQIHKEESLVPQSERGEEGVGGVAQSNPTKERANGNRGARENVLRGEYHNEFVITALGPKRWRRSSSLLVPIVGSEDT